MGTGPACSRESAEMQTSGLLIEPQHEPQESPGSSNEFQATNASIQDRLEVGPQQDADTRTAVPQRAEEQELAASHVSQEAPPAAKTPHTASQRVRLVDQALKTQDMDNGVFLQNVRDRLDR